jgi:hypothetical protein
MEFSRQYQNIAAGPAKPSYNPPALLTPYPSEARNSSHCRNDPRMGANAPRRHA